MYVDMCFVRVYRRPVVVPRAARGGAHPASPARRAGTLGQGRGGGGGGVPGKHMYSLPICVFGLRALGRLGF